MIILLEGLYGRGGTENKMEMRDITISLIFFALAISLLVGGYNGIKSAYDLTDTYTIDGDNIGSAIENLNIITSINQTVSAGYTLANPTGSVIDILGSLASTGLGTLKVIASIFTTPVEILIIIQKFYPIPGIIITSIAVLLTTIISFILISKWIRDRV